MARRIVLARHGVTGANLAGRFVGATDEPLSDEGKRQAQRLAGPIGMIRPDLVFSSPLERAVETARISTGQLDVEIREEADLMEADFGDWEMKTFDEASALDKASAQQWLRGELEGFVFPGGERMENFISRVGRVNEKMKNEKVDTVLAFTHGGVIGQSICQLLGISPSRHVLFRLAPASITIIEMFQGTARLTGIIDTAIFNGTG